MQRILAHCNSRSPRSVPTAEDGASYQPPATNPEKNAGKFLLRTQKSGIKTPHLTFDKETVSTNFAMSSWSH